MKFLVFIALFSVLSSVYCDDIWVDLTPADIDNFEVNQALNFGAENLTQDAIAKGLIPDGTYHLSSIESAQQLVDVSDDTEDNTVVIVNNSDDWDNNYRFVVNITNGEGSGLFANYTVHVHGQKVNGETVYSFYLSRYVYNWFTNLNKNEFGEDEFDWIYENEWGEFCVVEEEIEETVVENAGSGNEVVVVNTGETENNDNLVLVVQEDGETEWVAGSTVGV